MKLEFLVLLAFGVFLLAYACYFSIPRKTGNTRVVENSKFPIIACYNEPVKSFTVEWGNSSDGKVMGVVPMSERLKVVRSDNNKDYVAYEAEEAEYRYVSGRTIWKKIDSRKDAVVKLSTETMRRLELTT